MSNNSWEPTYGFCGTNEYSREHLARTLEAIRRQVCCYGGGDRCDCKYGLSVADTLEHTEFGLMDTKITAYNYHTGKFDARPNGEQTGCPELREMIHRLLHRDIPLM